MSKTKPEVRYKVNYEEFSCQFCANITISELFYALELNTPENFCEGGISLGRDEVLLSALREVLQYFLVESEYKEQMKLRGLL